MESDVLSARLDGRCDVEVDRHRRLHVLRMPRTGGRLRPTHRHRDGRRLGGASLLGWSGSWRRLVRGAVWAADDYDRPHRFDLRVRHGSVGPLPDLRLALPQPLCLDGDLVLGSAGVAGMWWGLQPGKPRDAVYRRRVQWLDRDHLFGYGLSEHCRTICRGWPGQDGALPGCRHCSGHLRRRRAVQRGAIRTLFQAGDSQLVG
mmetsp:Transcript_14976/g.41166  ORF Transcript_14976/g.41166 Transcript_14976/m.41166 type:complete len:203 (-) Transcript_14976:931-1539(-)